MVMKRTSDAALLQIPEEDLKSCQEAILATKSNRWALAYSRSRGTLLIRGRASAERRERVAAELESSLAEARADLAEKLVWAWSSGGDQRYFPNGDILILFEQGTSQEDRKRILGKIEGLTVDAHPDVAIKPPKKQGNRLAAK